MTITKKPWKPQQSAFMIVSFLAGTGSSRGFEGIMTTASPMLFGFSWDLTQCVFSSKSCCSIVTDKNLQSVLGVYSSSPHAPGKFSN